VSSAELAGQIESKVDEVYKILEYQSGNTVRRAEAVVSFSEKKVKRTYWYGKAEEEAPWEIYRISIEMLSGHTERGASILGQLPRASYHAPVLTPGSVTVRRTQQDRQCHESPALILPYVPCAVRRPTQDSHSAHYQQRYCTVPMEGTLTLL